MGVHPDALLEGAVDDLGQRRVRVRREGEVSDSGTRRFGIGTFLNKIGGVQADDVHTENLLRVPSKQHLRDAVALALGQSFGIRSKMTDGFT